MAPGSLHQALIFPIPLQYAPNLAFVVLSLPSQALFAVTSRRFAESSLEPSGKVAAVREAAFVCDLRYCSL